MKRKNGEALKAALGHWQPRTVAGGGAAVWRVAWSLAPNASQPNRTALLSDIYNMCTCELLPRLAAGPRG